MQNELKLLYKKSPKLALQVAKVLGYKIKVKAAEKHKPTLDEVIDFVTTYMSAHLFDYVQEITKRHGYKFKASEVELKKYLNEFFVSKIKV